MTIFRNPATDPPPAVVEEILERAATSKEKTAEDAIPKALQPPERWRQFNEYLK